MDKNITFSYWDNIRIFFKIQFFKNFQIFQYGGKTEYVGRKGQKIGKMKFLLKKEFNLKYIVLGYEINNN